MKIRLPFTFMYGPKGKRVFTLDTSRIKDFLDVSDDCVVRLGKVFSPPGYAIRPILPKDRIDYRVLATEYQKLLSDGICRDRADIARHRGVSRAWITMVYKRAKGI